MYNWYSLVILVRSYAEFLKASLSNITGHPSTKPSAPQPLIFSPITQREFTAWQDLETDIQYKTRLFQRIIFLKCKRFENMKHCNALQFNMATRAFIL